MEITSDSNRTINVYSQSGDDTSYSATFKNQTPLLNPDGSLKMGVDGKPVLAEDGTTQTIHVMHKNVGETAGGAFLIVEGSKTGVAMFFPDIAGTRTFKSLGAPTLPSKSAITVHELLDHGLDFIRTGNNNKSVGPSINNVSYQNDALKIINSTTRVGHDHKKE